MVKFTTNFIKKCYYIHDEYSKFILRGHKMSSNVQNPTLFRERIIPKECIELKDDIITYIDNDIIVTKWNALKPKKELHHGNSVYYLNEGFKVSCFLREDNSLIYWYCDIIKTTYDSDSNTYVFTDLLADVIIYPDGSVKVVDIDEIAETIEKEMISKDDVISSLKNLDKLLKLIYNGKLDELSKPIFK